MPVVAKNILSQLNEEGWSIKDEFLEDLLQDKSMNYQSVVKVLMNTDLKECGAACLSDGKGKSQIKLPVILQVSNIRNVSAPKSNEESQTAPRMLRITLTDGIKYIHGIEYSFIKSLSLKTAAGVKIKLHSKIDISSGYLLLNPSNTFVVGGHVEELFEKWKLSQSVSKYSRAAVSGSSGAPPWIPFGKVIEVERENNFKALKDKKKKEDDEFAHQRQKVVSELTKDGSQKVFGGGKQMLDNNVQRIINSGGFTIEEAEWALRKFKNDVPRAIQELRRIQGGDAPSEPSGPPPEDRGRGNRRGRGRGGRGRDDKGPDGSDDEMPHTFSSRPSGPASLFDYLKPKIKGDVSPPRSVEEEADSRPFRGRERGRGRSRGRGRGRGRMEDQQKTNRSYEVVLSNENWPSLGQEEEKESKQFQSNQATNSVSPQSYNSQQQASSKESYYQPRERDGQQHYRSSQQSGYNAGNYRQNYDNKPQNYHESQQNYRSNQTYRGNQQNYRENQQNYRENQQNYRESQTYRGSQENYRSDQENSRGNEQSYRGDQQNSSGEKQSSRGNQQSYRGDQQNYRGDQQRYRGDKQNYRGDQQNYRGDQQSYRGDQQNYRGDQQSYRGNQQNYRSDQQNYRGDQQNYRGGQQNYTGSQSYNRENQYSQPQYQQQNYKNESSGLSEYDRPKKVEQPYYRRGMGRDIQRGSSTVRGYGRGSYATSYNEQGDRANYNPPEGSRSYGKEQSADDRQLIARFEKTMITSGYYEAPSQKRNDYVQEGHQSYPNTYEQARQKGSYEYYRGGDGNARRSRGPRRGGY